MLIGTTLSFTSRGFGARLLLWFRVSRGVFLLAGALFSGTLRGQDGFSARDFLKDFAASRAEPSRSADDSAESSRSDAPLTILRPSPSDGEDAEDSEEPAAKDPLTRQEEKTASPLRSLAAAAADLAFRERSYYINDQEGNGKFHGAFVSAAWDDFAALAEYCEDHRMELRLEYLPLMNTFDVGKCRRVKLTEAPDGGWVYDFFWKPNNAKGKEQILLTVTLSESGLAAEQKECLDTTLDAETAILALDHIRLGVLRWSLLDEGAPDGEPADGAYTFVTPLFAPIEISDKFEPSPQAISIGERLQKKDVLPDLNFDADTEMKVTLASCAGLDPLAKGGRTSFLISDGSFEYTVTFAVAPTPKSADDRQLITVALINGLPADEVVKEFFFNSGIIEQVNASIYERELIIAGLQNSYVLVPNVSSSDPVVQKELFSQRKRLERINRNIDSRIRKYSGQIGRLRKSLDVELGKRLKKNLKFFQDRFAVTYKIYLTNKAIGPDEFLLCDSFAEREDYRPRDDENAEPERGVFDDEEIDPSQFDVEEIDDEDKELSAGGGEPSSPKSPAAGKKKSAK